MLNRDKWDSHTLRLMTGSLLLLPLLALLSVGPYWSWLVVVALAAGAGLWEFERLIFDENGLPPWWQAFYVLAGLLLPLGAAIGGAAGLHGMLVLSLFGGLSCLLVFSPLDPTQLDRLARLCLGWLYIPYLLSYVLLIGRMEAGRAWMFFILVVIVASDAGAYYCGKRFGRHKLYEAVSPKKTIEGSAGGLLASIILGTAFGVLCLGQTPVGYVVGFSGALALVGQVGDLMESMIKRMSGKKDASQLLPGHGGILDRLDSLLFAFPATWLFLTWMNRG
jgi:phosphatidate cytidylyltransferase